MASRVFAKVIILILMNGREGLKTFRRIVECLRFFISRLLFIQLGGNNYFTIFPLREFDRTRARFVICHEVFKFRQYINCVAAYLLHLAATNNKEKILVTELLEFVSSIILTPNQEVKCALSLTNMEISRNLTVTFSIRQFV